MLLRKIDLISPPITLYHKGENSHSSIFSGILTIIVYSICLTFGVLYAIDFFKKASPRVCYYNRYVEDAGEFPVNSSSMFNFIQIIDTKLNIPDIVDFDLIRIIGLEETIDLYEINNDLSKINHWIYGPCNNSTDTEGITNLINFEHFTESACIRKYYNKDKNKYYNTNDKEFIWPNILHGCSHPNRTFYGIIMEKCRNNTLKLLSDGKLCKSNEEIIEYIKERSVNFQLIDQYTDILNYSTPYRKYFYSISNGLFEESYTTNHLNLNPTTLISDEGYFIENKKITLSYFFDQNEKVTTSSGDSGIYVAFYFWMQNRMQYYERAYQKVQDVLSDVGGLCSIVLELAELINTLVNYYIILFDMQTYMYEIENSKVYDKNIFRIKINNFNGNINKNNNKLSPPKYRMTQKYQNIIYNESSNKNKLIKEEIGLFDKNISNIFEKNNDREYLPKKNKSKNRSIFLNNYSDNNHYSLKSSNLKKQNIRGQKRGYSLSLKNVTVFKNKETEDIKEVKDSKTNDNLEKSNNINKELKKNDTPETRNINVKENYYRTKIRFYRYLLYLLSCTKCNSNIRLYSEFRRRMISEENLILNYLNICKLFKLNKYENLNINKDIDIENIRRFE